MRQSNPTQIICVHIKPNSKHNESVEPCGEFYEVTVKSPAVQGRANARAVELIAEYFDTSKSCVKIVHGAKSRYKVVEIVRPT